MSSTLRLGNRTDRIASVIILANYQPQHHSTDPCPDPKSNFTLTRTLVTGYHFRYVIFGILQIICYRFHNSRTSCKR